MAFASIRSTASTASMPFNATWTVTLPATIENGDLLLVFLSVDGNTSITWDQSSHGTWTSQYETAQGALTGVCYAKVADGTEDSGTLSITLGTAERGSYVAFAIQDWEGTLSGVTAGTAATGSGTNPDPPSVTAAGGSGDNFFIAMSHSDGSADITGYPTNYSDNQTHLDETNANGCTTAYATRDLSGETDNPSSFTLASSEQYVANTLVVEPAAGGSGVTIVVPTGPWR